MPAMTPGGWPYVLPADHPLEYPAQSQSLANLLEQDARPRYRGSLASTTCPNGSPTQPTAWTTEVGRRISHAAGTFTVTDAGVYMFSFRYTFAAVIVDNTLASISLWIAGSSIGGISPGTPAQNSVANFLHPVSAGQTFHVTVYQNSGSTQTFSGGIDVVKVSGL